jgi:hypothetical protein
MNEPRNEPLYTEWVLPKWSSFLPILAIYPTLWLTFLPINLTLGIWSGLGLSVVAVGLMFAKSARIAVDSESLKVSNAQIDRQFISGAEVIQSSEGFAERGRNLDARAWIHFQGSVKTLVKVNISDPEDPTPYWLFSTRNPAELVKALGY